MKIADVIKSDSCKRIFDEVNSFVSKSLKEYNSMFSTENHYSSKDIFDFVWGTIELSPAEIIVLDSPLLQRLRRINHLGMAEVVYCNATCSRFSHTIGVVETSRRMAEMVSKSLGHVEYDNGFEYDEIVRMAALFHDTGHMMYSHASELYFTHNKKFPRHKEISKALAYFCEKTKSNCSLHEMLSVMIVNSDETKRLISNASQYMKNKTMTVDEKNTFLEYISGLIIGTPVDKSILPYSSIINGAIDADKLDYLFRDSEATKVPIAVDIARIIQKLTVVDVKQIVFSDVWMGKKDCSTYKIMGIKNSAKKVFFQLASARLNMFESVYYHHKVLTAETMFRNMLENYFRSIDNEKISFTDILDWTDDSFSDFWEYLKASNYLNETSRKNVGAMIKKLKNRDLYKRVAAFSADNINGGESYIFVRNVVQKGSDEEYDAFLSKLQEFYMDVYKRTYGNNPNKAIFDFTYAESVSMPAAPIEAGEGSCIWSSKLLKQSTMHAGEQSKTEQFYLLSDCDRRELAYVAFEKTLFVLYGITLDREASVCLKGSMAKLDDKRINLLHDDYYKGCLPIISDELIGEFVKSETVDEIVAKYSSFEGTGGWKINRDRVIKFFRQFLVFDYSYEEIKSMFDGLVRLLINGMFIDRKIYVEASKLWFKQLGESERYDMILIGNAKDSSSHYAYYINDSEHKDIINIFPSLQKALADKEISDTICFCDDGAYSGKQIISIFQEYMGVENRLTDEHHVDELSAEEKETILRKKIRILFVVLNRKNQEFIITELKKLGLEDVEIISYKGMEKLLDEGSIFHEDNQRQIVYRTLKEIGKEVVYSKKGGKSNWNEDRIDDAALGYNDSQQMVITVSSVPTYTLTPFWMQGMFREEKWEGLFLRTDK